MTDQTGRAEAPRERGRLQARRVTIRTGEAARHFTLTPRTQVLAAAGALLLLAWSGAATVTAVVAGLEREALAARVEAFEAGSADAVAEAEARHAAELARAVDARDARISDLEQTRDALAAEAADARARLAVLSRELGERQSRLRRSADAEAELGLALEALRARLREAVEARDAAERRQAALSRELDEYRRRDAAAEAAEDEWTAAIATVTEALETTAQERDAAALMRASLADRLETLQQEQARADEARARLFAQLEDAVEAGLGALDGVFDKAGLDAERLVSEIRRDYQGQGGPFIPVDEAAAPQLASADAARVASLMDGLERASLMQVAAAKLPLARPVRAAHRFTSGFGVRRDPVNGRSRMHAGSDFAARIGTPIHAAADGVVVFSGWQSGYGRVVKIRHAFGFETVYAHLNKARVKVGDRVARDDRIGDMGRTGRVTGTHLHYEIRMNGKPVNPMRYIEAARNVL